MGVDARAPAAYLLGSGGAAVLNFPPWKASAMAQSGFCPRGGSYASAHAAALRPPHPRVPSVAPALTSAPFAIVYARDVRRPIIRLAQQHGRQQRGPERLRGYYQRRCGRGHPRQSVRL